MTKREPAGTGDEHTTVEAQREMHYSHLFRKFVLLTMVCSLLPLLLVGWGMNIHYTRLAESRMTESFQTRVEHHCKIIELFLKERSTKLQLVARTHKKDFLARQENLQEVFRLFNSEGRSFTDLGVISREGRHLAYIGPFDLMDKDYSKAFWFKEVLDKGIYISDMFMGFRQEPHFVIAVAGSGRQTGSDRQTGSGRQTGAGDEEQWILRATIDTEVFRSLVEDVRIGRTGEVYLVNHEGICQTSPRFSGAIMAKAPFTVGSVHDGISVHLLEDGADGENRRIVGKAWLGSPRWMLVVSQDHAEAFSEVNHANFATLIFLHLSAATILIVAVLITRHMVSVIRMRDIEADRLNNQLVQAGKLASIGELSAGVAHEINNPLAIILTERQLMLDEDSRVGVSDGSFKEQFDDSMAQIDVQIGRCKRITSNLLRFSRRTESKIEPVDVNVFLEEVIDLMEREARTGGVEFRSELDESLRPILSDPSQLQQVFLNLVTNAVDAHDSMPGGSITIATRRSARTNGMQVEISDTGSGIRSEIVEKIFDPFFTTKPVGKGTGLGLSICYSIVKRLGGDIDVESTPGKGTRFSLFLPDRPPPELLESLAENSRDQKPTAVKEPAK